MNHLFNISVYHAEGDIAKARAFCDGRYADGLETLTGYEPVDPSFKECSGSVHLPYAVDWYGPLTGRRPADPSMEPGLLRYRHYGRDRDEIVAAVRRAIEMAAPLEPGYGVMHAGNANIDELLCYDYSESDTEVIDALAEVMNDAVSAFPSGEPPFTIAFENTWWPGMRMTDSAGYKRLASKLEFEDWCVCLDTGHLLFSMKGSDDEAGALEILNGCVDGYTSDLMERIVTMHLHVNTSRKILRTLADPDSASVPTEERIKRAYKLIGNVDQHRPFSDPGVRDLVERIDPDYIVHEMGAVVIEDQIRDHICQRSFFD
jgi:hypothetical protein